MRGTMIDQSAATDRLRAEKLQAEVMYLAGDCAQLSPVAAQLLKSAAALIGTAVAILQSTSGGLGDSDHDELTS